MSVAVQTFTAPSITSANSVVVTKPTGLAVGDLMVAFIAKLQAGTIDTISGWTDSGAGQQGVASSGTTLSGKVLYKVATSGDVAASNFTFTLTGGAGSFIGASIHRIDGQHLTTPIDQAFGNSRQDDSSISAAGGDYAGPSFAPTRANELYLFFVAASGGTSISGYTIETSSPSWTEDYDTASTLIMSAAHGTRSAATNTGNLGFVVDSGTGTTDTVGFFLIIKDVLSVTIAADLLSMASSTQAPTMTGGATVSPAAISMASSMKDPSYANQAKWSPKEKSSAPTLTASTKSSAPTLTAATKSSAPTLTPLTKTT